MRDDPVIMGSYFVMLLVLINPLTFARSQDLNPSNCGNRGNYTQNSTYSANLNTTLTSLSSNMGDNGFYNATAGEGQDRAYAIALCRGDVLRDRCRSCVENAAVELRQVCPSQKEAIRWYDLCMLRYSNQPIYGILANEPGSSLRNTEAATNPRQFREDRTALLDVLRGRAANGSSLLKVAAGSRNTSDSDTLYGLLQCTPDLSQKDCDYCLIQAGQPLSSTAVGMRILRPSCNLRYELYNFYNETRLRELRVLVPQIPNSPPGNKILSVLLE